MPSSRASTRSTTWPEADMDKTFRKQVNSELKRRRYVVYTILLLSFIYLAAGLLLGDRGVMRYLQLKEREGSLKTELSAINDDNEKLRSIIESYEENDFFVEKNARENFGLAGPGEYIYLYEK